MGAETYLYIDVAKNEDDDLDDAVSLIARVSSRTKTKAGDKIKVSVDTSRIHIFDKETEQCIIH